MKGFIRQVILALWNFFKVVHSGSEDGSAKRLYGGIIILASLVIIYLVALNVIPNTIWMNIESIVSIVFNIGASLLGLNAINEIVKAVKNKPQ